MSSGSSPLPHIPPSSTVQETPVTSAGGVPRSSHVDAEGNLMMVDVSGKETTERAAVAEGRIFMSGEAPRAALKHSAVTVAQLAGIMAAKRTSGLIPLCHPLPLTNCDIKFFPEQKGLRAVCTVKTANRTGVEMEALTADSIALLTVCDMLKGIDKSMEIGGIRLLRKTGGKSGVFSARRALPAFPRTIDVSKSRFTANKTRLRLFQKRFLTGKLREHCTFTRNKADERCRDCALQHMYLGRIHVI